MSDRRSPMFDMAMLILSADPILMSHEELLIEEARIEAHSSSVAPLSMAILGLVGAAASFATLGLAIQDMPRSSRAVVPRGTTPPIVITTSIEIASAVHGTLSAVTMLLGMFWARQQIVDDEGNNL